MVCSQRSPASFAALSSFTSLSLDSVTLDATHAVKEFSPDNPHTCFRQLLPPFACSVYEILSMYETSFAKITEKYFKATPWPTVSDDSFAPSTGRPWRGAPSPGHPRRLSTSEDSQPPLPARRALARHSTRVLSSPPSLLTAGASQTRPHRPSPRRRPSPRTSTTTTSSASSTRRSTSATSTRS